MRARQIPPPGRAGWWPGERGGAGACSGGGLRIGQQRVSWLRAGGLLGALPLGAGLDHTAASGYLASTDLSRSSRGDRTRQLLSRSPLHPSGMLLYLWAPRQV